MNELIRHASGKSACTEDARNVNRGESVKTSIKGEAYYILFSHLGDKKQLD